MAFDVVGCRTHPLTKKQQSEISDNQGQGEVLFLRYRPGGNDEQQMRKLVFNNAFLGQPFDVICRCERWFSDVVLTPDVKYQPENIHVAIHNRTGNLVGYLTGSMGGQHFEELQYNWVRKQVISLAMSLAVPWTFFYQRSLLFATHVIFKGERERPSHPKSGVHWHFQVDKEFRSQRIGTALLRRFINDAIAADFELIWAEVMAYPEKPPEYFEERGWSIYDAKPTLIFGDRVDFPVQILSITKPLSSFEELAPLA